MMRYSSTRASRIDGKPSMRLLCVGSGIGQHSRILNVEGVPKLLNVNLHFSDLILPGDPEPDTVSEVSEVSRMSQGCWQRPDSRGRVRLTNTVCNNWVCMGTCNHGDHCIFLHEEKPLPFSEDAFMMRPDVATDEPVPKNRTDPVSKGPVKDVRIYVSNMPSFQIAPHMTNEEWLREFAEQYGDVQVVDLVKSRVADGSVFGFVHMSSEAQADLLIKHFNCISISGKFVHAHIEKVRDAPVQPKRLYKRTAPAEPAYSIDEEGFKQKRNTNKSDAVTSTPISVPVARTGFAALLDEQEEEEEEEELVDEAEEVAEVRQEEVKKPVPSSKGKAKMTSAQLKKELDDAEKNDIEAIVAGIEAQEAETKSIQEARDHEIAKRMSEGEKSQKPKGKKKKKNKTSREKVEILVETPVETPVETLDTLVETLVETPVETPVEVMPALEVVSSSDEVRKEVASPVHHKPDSEDASPVTVTGLNPWGNAERGAAMRNDLAILRKEKAELAAALDADRAIARAAREEERILKLALYESINAKQSVDEPCADADESDVESELDEEVSADEWEEDWEEDEEEGEEEEEEEEDFSEC